MGQLKESLNVARWLSEEDELLSSFYRLIEIFLLHSAYLSKFHHNLSHAQTTSTVI